MPNYCYIEDPKRPDVQLAANDYIMFLFSSQDLARKWRDKWGSGIIRCCSIAELKKRFCSCYKVHLDPGEEDPRTDEAISLSDLK